MTWIELAKEVAAEFGRTLTDSEADHVLWEHTGFPDFWHIPEDGATPQDCARKQLREHFAKEGYQGSVLRSPFSDDFWLLYVLGSGVHSSVVDDFYHWRSYRDARWARVLRRWGAKHRDGCQRCHGTRGGVCGNENIVNGEILCDYCHADDLK